MYKYIRHVELAHNVIREHLKVVTKNEVDRFPTETKRITRSIRGLAWNGNEGRPYTDGLMALFHNLIESFEEGPGIFLYN